MTNIQQHLSLLGHRVKDKVSGHQGVVSSISFDLYGCIQAAVDQGCADDGKRKDSYWFDISRLVKVASNADPVMVQPYFVEEKPQPPAAEGHHGPAEKPAML